MKFINLSISLLLISLLFFTNCGSAQEKTSMKMEQNPPFTIDNATSQKWVAGTKEGGSGTNIKIVFSNIDENVVIQNVYFQNEMAEAKTTQQNINEVTAYFLDTKKDVIMDSDPMKETINTINGIPFQLNDKEAVLEYWFNSNKHYFKILDISEKELLPYPSSNKN